ncbi:MAG: sensor domain-containing diguanylate cyclase [Deltaproteobacteria bacterium]|nr:sensor domain-containing diguanylate cyclase [Deltaproteobacteria bacterium]
MKSKDDNDKQVKSKVGIVGCGRGCTAILDLLYENPAIQVEWIADNNPYATGMKKAKALKIPVVEDFHAAIGDHLDLVINVTGSQEVGNQLKKVIGPDTELMGGASALFVWQMALERQLRLADRDRVLREHETLYHLGLLIENIDSLYDAGLALIDYTLKMLRMPAASLAIYDEKENKMRLLACKGFSRAFQNADSWEIREEGITNRIFQQNSTLYVKNLEKFNSPSPLLLNEGVKTVIAAPLAVEGKVFGIFYVNDFKVREISPEDMSIFSLLSVYASLTIDRVRALEAIRQSSIVDGLTGLYNHRHLMSVLEMEIKRAYRYKSSFTVFMLDIDYFKKYNDAFGHLEGNKVLKDLAAIFNNVARDTDTVGRFGGEEFCIITPELDKKNARLFGERLLKAVRDYEFPNKKVTISGGCATFPEDGKIIPHILKLADERLYLAKNAGRDRIYCNSED